jgi:hypothetical protein
VLWQQSVAENTQAPKNSPACLGGRRFIAAAEGY